MNETTKSEAHTMWAVIRFVWGEDWEVDQVTLHDAREANAFVHAQPYEVGVRWVMHEVTEIGGDA